MTRRKVFAAAAVCVLVFEAAVIQAQVSSSKIEGMVTDDAGKGLAGVKVEAAESATGTRTTSTDKSGRYRFIGVAPGEYKVAFTLGSHADVLKYGTLRLGATLTINVKMFRVGN
jgi:hypothetical protein